MRTAISGIVLVTALLLVTQTAFAIVIQGDMRPGPDLDLANKVKAYLEQRLKGCTECRITITVKGGHVLLLGVVKAGSLPHLRAIKANVAGVKSINLDRVQINPEPQPRTAP